MECFEKRHGFVNTGGPPYPRVIGSKTYRSYVKPRIIPNAIYNVLQRDIPWNIHKYGKV